MADQFLRLLRSMSSPRVGSQTRNIIGPYAHKRLQKVGQSETAAHSRLEWVLSTELSCFQSSMASSSDLSNQGCFYCYEKAKERSTIHPLGALNLQPILLLIMLTQVNEDAYDVWSCHSSTYPQWKNE
ncbi:hypothetical protein Ancab_006153 [Ancistrocladus abbreviatus]